MSFEAVVFPGQGAQKKGMANDFYNENQAAQLIFEQANQHLSFDVKEMCFEDKAELHQTIYTQPCIVTAEIAMLESLKEQHPTFQPQFFAGHSLGEYSALVAAGVLPFKVAIQLVARRGELMHQANVDGAMAAIIMDDLPLKELQMIAEQYNIDVANDNSRTQVVLSGAKADLIALIEKLELSYEAQGIRCVMLNVSAPFHSRYMKDIEQEFKGFLNKFKDSFVSAKASMLVSNYLGRFYNNNTDEVIDSLSKQLSGSVKWRDNMAALLSKTNLILELGPNRPLRGFFKTLDVDITSIINLRSASKVFSS